MLARLSISFNLPENLPGNWTDALRGRRSLRDVYTSLGRDELLRTSCWSARTLFATLGAPRKAITRHEVTAANRGPHKQVFVCGVENRGPHKQVFVCGVATRRAPVRQDCLVVSRRVLVDVCAACADDPITCFTAKARARESGSGYVEQLGEHTGTDQNGTAMEQDRRQHRRYPVEGWAEILVMDGTMFFRGEIIDISSAGCYIATRAELDLVPGALVEMIFRLRGAEFRPIAATRIVRPGDGAGFAFVTLNSKLQAQLDALIEVLSEARERT